MTHAPPTPASHRSAHPGARPGRAFTLVEMLVALSVVAVLSTAVATLLFGATNTYRFVRSCDVAGSEMDFGVRRLTSNLTAAQTGTIVLGTTSVTSGSNSLSCATLAVLSQPDPANSFPVGAAVSYTLQADAANVGQFILTETDQRYGTNTLIHNVKTFNVTAVSGASSLYQVDLVLGDPLSQERHFKVFNRN